MTDKFKVLIDRPGLFLIIDEQGRMRQWWTGTARGTLGAGHVPWRTAL